MRHPTRKLLTRMRQEPSGPALEPQKAMKQAHNNIHFEKSCKLCKKHGGAHTTHFTKDCCKYKKDRMVKADFRTAKEAGKKPNLAKQLFAQLSKKLDKLEKILKKASHKSKKRPRDDSD
jgi:hypothetical protein